MGSVLLLKGEVGKRIGSGSLLFPRQPQVLLKADAINGWKQKTPVYTLLALFYIKIGVVWEISDFQSLQDFKRKETYFRQILQAAHWWVHSVWIPFSPLPPSCSPSNATLDGTVLGHQAKRNCSSMECVGLTFNRKLLFLTMLPGC